MGPLIAQPSIRLGFLAIVAVLLIVAAATGAAGARHREDAARSTTRASCRSSCGCPRTRRSRRTAGVASALADEALARRGGDQRPELHGHRVALHVQRPRASLLPAPRAAPGGPAGGARRQGRTDASRATPSRSGCARGSTRRRSALGAHIQVVEVPPGPPVLQTHRRGGLRPGPASAAWRSRRRSDPSSRGRPASSTWTGTWTTRGRSGGSKWTPRRRRPPACRRRTWPRWCAWPAPGSPAGLLHDPRRAGGRADRPAAAARSPRLARRRARACGWAARTACRLAS